MNSSYSVSEKIGAFNPTPAPTVFRYVGKEDWSSLLPSWQIICLCMAISLLVCWLRAHPGAMSYIKCLKGGPEGRWIAVQQDIEEEDEDDEDEHDVEGGGGDAQRTRAISMKYRELRNEGYSTSEAMELAESIVSLEPQPRNGSFKEFEDDLKKKVDTSKKNKTLQKRSDSLGKNKTETATAKTISPPQSPVRGSDGKVVISGFRKGLKNVLKPKPGDKMVPEVLKVVEVAEDDQWYPGAYPRTKPLHMKKLQKEEKKLQRFRLLQKEGYEDSQARFLAGLPREDNEEEFLWSEIQDEINNQTYYWDGDSVTTFKKPFDIIWRVFVVFKPSSKHLEDSDNSSNKKKPSKAESSSTQLRKGEIAAKEFEFGKGDWVDLGIVGLPPRAPAGGPGSPKKNKVANLEAKQKPAPSISSLGKSSSFMDRFSIFSGRGGSLPRPDITGDGDNVQMLGEEENEEGDDNFDDGEKVNIRGMGGEGVDGKKKGQKLSKKSEDKLRNSISSPRY